MNTTGSERIDKFTGTAESAGFTPSIAQRITGLDELRGLAILSVMFAHFFGLRERLGIDHLHLGGPGVDLFFMISGFLIAKILLEDKGHPHYFRRFYVRRAFRILPLYAVTVTALCILSAVTNMDWSSWPFYVVFLQNFLADPLTALKPIAGLGPLWSLAVEEQFYLCLPLIICFVPVRFLPAIFFALAACGIALKGWRHSVELENVYWGYTNPTPTWFRMQYLVMGCLLATKGFPQRTLIALLGFWLVVVLVLADYVGAIEFAVCACLLWLVRQCVHGKPPILNTGLAWAGRLCFGLYLMHLPILIITRQIVARLGMDLAGIVSIVLFFTVTFVLATLSFHLFETPISRLRTRFEGTK